LPSVPAATPTDRRIAVSVSRSLLPYLQSRFLSLRVLPLAPPSAKPLPAAPITPDEPIRRVPDAERVKILHEQLDALTVQRDQLREQLRDAKRLRQIEAIEALEEAAQEVQKEWDRVRKELEEEASG
ncbi:hypothetical protein HDU93_004954, partial [Gonapodya sp. JEL0774]